MTLKRYLVGADLELRAVSAREAEMQVRSALVRLAETGEIDLAYVGEAERMDATASGYRLVKETSHDAA